MTRTGLILALVVTLESAAGAARPNHDRTERHPRPANGVVGQAAGTYEVSFRFTGGTCSLPPQFAPGAGSTSEIRLTQWTAASFLLPLPALSAHFAQPIFVRIISDGDRRLLAFSGPVPLHVEEGESDVTTTAGLQGELVDGNFLLSGPLFFADSQCSVGIEITGSSREHA